MMLVTLPSVDFKSSCVAQTGVEGALTVAGIGTGSPEVGRRAGWMEEELAGWGKVGGVAIVVICPTRRRYFCRKSGSTEAEVSSSLAQSVGFQSAVAT